MLSRLLLPLLLALAAPVAAQTPTPQRPDGAEYWTPSDQRMTFTAAGISFPRRVGAVGLNRSIAFGRQNAGLDNGLIYASDDRALIATAYVYLPGRADAGLSALVTEHSMRLQSGAGFRALGSRIAAAGGREGVAIRADYAGFREGNEASSSAFLRIDRWIVKLRVSGPEARRADVERTMAALLAEIRFRDGDAPGAAVQMTLGGNCPPAPATEPALLRSPPDAVEATEDAIMAAAAALHGEDRPGPPEPDAAGRMLPRTWCLSSLRQAEPYAMPILRTLPSPPAEDSRRSVALALLNDSDGIIEVVERRLRNRSRFTLIWHSTGRTNILGTYDGPPTDAQIKAVIDGSDEAGTRARAVIDYEANGNSTITLNVRPDAGR